MTPSTTNTAAREVVEPVRTDEAQHMCGTGCDCPHEEWDYKGATYAIHQDEGELVGTVVMLDEGHEEVLPEVATFAEARLQASAWIDGARTLTQQQGGEQEADVEQQARELLAAEYEQEGYDFAAKCIRGGNTVSVIEDRAIRAIVAALRTKQPAASEGDGQGFSVCEINSLTKWVQAPFGVVRARDEVIVAHCTHKDSAEEVARALNGQPRMVMPLEESIRIGNELLNTSKQAAGEAVACVHSWHDYGTHGKVNLSWCSKCSMLSATGSEGTPYGAPPRHPADEGKDAARYRWLRKQHNESVTGVYVCDDQGLSIGMNLDDALDAAIIRAAP